LEINTLEFLIVTLWSAGVVAGLYFYLSARSVRSMLVLGGSLVIPVLGSTVAVVLVDRFRALRKKRKSGADADCASRGTSEQASETAETAKPEEEVLTVENSSDLAALLAITDYCIEPASVFAAQHQGKTIAFDGSIGAMIPHGDYKIRYDILIGAGDFSETTSPGPAFQFRDVNATSDMHFTDTDRPDTMGVGDNLRLTARVVGFAESSCLFLLDPVRTSFR